jgi:hypothetical protein
MKQNEINEHPKSSKKQASIKEITALQPWPIKNFRRDGFFLFLGRRGAGKTTAMELLLQLDPYAKDSIHIAMCGSAKVKSFWSKRIPRLYCVEPNIPYIRHIISMQNQHIERYEQLGLPLPDHLHVNFILDDIALYQKIMKDPIFTELSGGSRQLWMRISFLAQYLHQVPKEIRSAFDGVGIGGDFSDQDLKEIYSSWANFVEKRDFIASFFTYTQSQGDMLIIDKYDHGCYHLKSQYPMPLIRFGRASQWQHSEDHYKNVEAIKAKKREQKLAEEEQDEEILHYKDEKGTIVFRPPRIKQEVSDFLHSITPSSAMLELLSLTSDKPISLHPTSTVTQDRKPSIHPPLKPVYVTDKVVPSYISSQSSIHPERRTLPCSSNASHVVPFIECMPSSTLSIIGEARNKEIPAKEIYSQTHKQQIISSTPSSSSNYSPYPHNKNPVSAARDCSTALSARAHSIRPNNVQRESEYWSQDSDSDSYESTYS